MCERLIGKMDVFEAIKTRRSIRKYQNKPVEQEKLSKVLEAARLSPSAANRQPWRFIVVTDPEVKEKLRAAYNRDWFISAPVIIVGCALPHKAWVRSDGEEYWKVDLAIAMNCYDCMQNKDNQFYTLTNMSDEISQTLFDSLLSRRDLTNSRQRGEHERLFYVGTDSPWGNYRE